VLVGAVNPGGRLPTTFPRRLADVPAMLNYPGEHGRVLYGEGLFIGYRAFDRMAIEPRFPFGHGLSYTTFSYGPATVAPDGSSVSVDVTNTGPAAGDEVVQLYVRDVDASVVRPEKELKGFVRLRSLAPGETRTATFALDDRSFAFWDPSAHDWVVEPGEFELLVGASAADVRSRATLVR
jgi:beta-glucosidase